MRLGSFKITKVTKEKKTKPVKQSHFNETAKVIQQFIRDEEAEDRRVSPLLRLHYLKEALGQTRDIKEHDRLEKEIKDLEMKIKFGEASELVHTLPEDKKEMIMENYRIEKAEAETDLAATNSDIKDLKNELEKVQKNLDYKKYQARKLAKMLQEATAVEKAFNGELDAIYYDDKPIIYQRKKGLSELGYLRIEHLKEDK